MEQIGNVMYVKAGYYAEYKKRHDELWPEMENLLKSKGVNNYSIFLNEENGELFAVLSYQNKELYDQIAESETCKKWWDYMSDIMLVNADNSPKTKELKRVFHLK